MASIKARRRLERDFRHEKIGAQTLCFPDGWIMLDREMNDRKSPPPGGSAPAAGVAALMSPSRRRFARAAAPVLLGTLASKPVLGQEYICTVSGHTSGNASAHNTQVLCNQVGEGVAYWREAATWPTGLVKGSLPEVGTRDNGSKFCDFGSSGQGTPFNGFGSPGPTLLNTFHFATANNGCGLNTNTNRPAASLYQVLAQDRNDVLYKLGRVTVVSLLNAAQFGSSYPVSQGRIIAMFNAVKGGGSYRVEGANLDLTQAGVIQYLEKLYS